MLQEKIITFLKKNDMYLDLILLIISFIGENYKFDLTKIHNSDAYLNKEKHLVFYSLHHIENVNFTTFTFLQPSCKPSCNFIKKK